MGLIEKMGFSKGHYFSVIVPTFNRFKLLKETIESLKSTSENNEIIVVDDGSTDGTIEFIKQAQPEVLLIEQANQGPGAARNRGIEAASGEFIAFLDSDDLWFPWTLPTYREVIEKSGAGLVLGKPLHFKNSDDLKQINAPAESSAWNSFSDYFASCDEWRWWGASSFVVRRDLLDKVRFLERAINGEDADFIMKLGSGIRLAQVLNVPTFAYREHEGSIMKNFDKTLAGAWNLVQSENSGRYPGGKAREGSRRVILGRHIRPVILELLRSGRKVDGWNLFRETLPWHIQQQRWKFVIATLLLKFKTL
jgi:glycosyltransferase involved in cell wall biosynthesis